MRVKPAACPICDTVLDAVTGFNTNLSPRNGDITCCSKCATILVFTETLDLRVAIEEDLKQCPSSMLIMLGKVKEFVSKLGQQKKRF